MDVASREENDRPIAKSLRVLEKDFFVYWGRLKKNTSDMMDGGANHESVALDWHANTQKFFERVEAMGDVQRIFHEHPQPVAQSPRESELLRDDAEEYPDHLLGVYMQAAFTRLHLPHTRAGFVQAYGFARFTIREQISKGLMPKENSRVFAKSSTKSWK